MYSGGKGGRCIRLTTFSPSCVDCLLLESLRSCPGIYRETFTFVCTSSAGIGECDIRGYHSGVTENSGILGDLSSVLSSSVEMKALDCFERSACAYPATPLYVAVWLFPAEPKNVPAVPNAAQLSSNLVISIHVRSVTIPDPEVNYSGTVKCRIVYLPARPDIRNQNLPLKTVTIDLQDFEHELKCFE
jgi:hypothetical protein